MLKSKMLKDTLLLTAMQLILDSAALLLNVFVTKKLGASAVGIFSLISSFMGLAGIVSNGNAFLCTSRLISEELGKKDGDPNKVLRHGIKLCVLLSAAVSVVLFTAADKLSAGFFGSAEMSGAIRLMPAALGAGAVTACIKGYFNACRRSGISAAGDIFEFTVKTAVIVFLVINCEVTNEAQLSRLMMLSLIIGNCLSMIFLSVLFFLKHEKYHGKGSLSFKAYAKAAFPIMGGGILTAVLSSTNDALIPVCLREYGDSASQSLSLFGIFEAIVIPTLFFPSVVLCSMSGIIVSEAARASAAGNTDRIKNLTSALIQGTFVYSVFAASVIMRFGNEIGELLGGGETAGKIIPVIAPVIPFIYLEIILEALIKGMGLQSFSSLNYLAEYIIRISVVLILVPKLGFSGIAASYYASNVFGNTMRLIKILRFTSVRFRPVKTVLMPVVYSFLTMGTAELLFRGMPEKNIFSMIIFTLLWLSIYGAVFVISSKGSLRSLRAVPETQS